MQKPRLFIISGLVAAAVAAPVWHHGSQSEKPTATTAHPEPITIAIMVGEESHKGRVFTRSDDGNHAFCAYGFDASHAGGKHHDYQIEITRNPEPGSFRVTRMKGFPGLKENSIITLNTAGQWRHEEQGATVEISIAKPVPAFPPS